MSALQRTIGQLLGDFVPTVREPRRTMAVELHALPADQLQALARVIGLPEADIAAHLLAAAIQETIVALPNAPDRYHHAPTGQTVGLADGVAYELGALRFGDAASAK